MATELVDGVWWLDLGGVNAYLAEDGPDPALVDAGTPWAVDDLRAEIRDAGHEPGDVARVLVTHYDVDHVGGLGRLGLGSPVYVGARDADFVTGRRSPPATNHKGLLQLAAGLFVSPPPGTVRPVDDGDEVGSFAVFHTPGHTPGHVAYVSEDLDVAFLGDLVRAADGGLEASPWAMSYDTDAVRESVRDLAERAPDFAAACPGHGTPLRSDGSGALRRLAQSARP